ncbi:uncharacterized protein LOC114148841 [Xiphophorus couchianus]|uniref:uncharacterized protein LOC114148841 n=1 Tax=Xiphophorus couchianus TaxID=32473 RepID=UPI0010160640|nr:uncharacterized protein LOC114148841 [Xiphophorus couchianus]
MAPGVSRGCKLFTTSCWYVEYGGVDYTRRGTNTTLLYDFKVIQPEFQHVNPDQTSSISCEHDSYESKLHDVRLYRISQNEEELLCQKGQASCKDVTLCLSSTKFVFTLRNIRPETIRATYQCEITVEYGGVDYTRRGTNTTLLYDFKVIQPEFQHVNPDQTSSISCEHDSYESKLHDVRLYRISQNEEELLCQKGQASCKDVTLSLSSTKFVFTLRNIRPETIRATYQCEITVEYGGVDYTRRGTNTTLLYGEKDCPPLDKSVLGWILIGLLALMFLYSCVITCLYVRLTATVWKNTKACENSTYVVMNPPTQKRQHEDIYQMMQS